MATTALEPAAREAAHPLLPQIFADSVARHASEIAIDVPPSCDGARGRPVRQMLTYAELDARVQALAERIAARIAGLEEPIVTLLLSRGTVWLWIAQLAVQRAGAAYTCLDPAFPDARKREVIEDAASPLVLSDAAGTAQLRAIGLGANVPGDLVHDVAIFAESPERAPCPAEIAPDSLAYVIYTSGTTGKPKGVMIEHRAIANLVACDTPFFGLGPGDRVVQGSSPAYDSSVEEIWMALASGATLLAMDDATARLGPDLTGWLRAERATVLTPPPTLLRAMGCAEPTRELPDLRLLYVGGEALPADIADLWAKGIRMVNGYGPTECAVTCVRSEVSPGAPVTIGKAVPGMTALVLDDDLNDVPDGSHGELCMAGVGLARGYRNRPELTAEKFVDHPRHGRIYRTGDLVHIDADTGDFHYHGRIDAQVKIRGYRVELGEIEARLAMLPGVRAAACTLQDRVGGAALVAHIVPIDLAQPLDTEALRTALAETLPHYMVPQRIGLIEALPVSVSGKLDRRLLPVLDLGAEPEAGEAVAPEGALENLIATAAADVLARAAPPSVVEDFFEGLGGDSLRAAMLVTLLRDHPETARVTVSDIYEARTIRALAELIAAGCETDEDAVEAPPVRHGKANVLLANCVQLPALWAVVSVASWAGYLAAFHVIPALFARFTLTQMIVLFPLIAALAVAAYIPASIVFAVAVKRLVIGKYRPMRAPVWSAYYLRHWLVMLAARVVPWPLIQGSALQVVALRALGATIGDRVHIHRGVDLRRGGWDLLTLGDDVALAQDVVLGLVELDRGDIVVGAITLQAGVALESRAILCGDVIVGAGSVLTPLSVLNPGARVPAGEVWDGVPARSIGPAPMLTALAQLLTPAGYGARLLGAEAVLGLIVALPAELLLIGAARTADIAPNALWRWFYAPDFTSRVAAVILGVTVLATPLTLVWSALMMRALGRVRPGTFARWSPAYLRVWLKSALLTASGQWLSGTLFWPHWLRLAGMQIGRDCEISTIIDVVPELVTIGEETFFADGIYLGGAKVRQGTVTLAETSLGRHTFLGNHAVIPAGSHLPDDILIGVCTVADDSKITSGHARFGHPSFDLPRREVVEMASDISLTHKPTKIRYVNRLFWESARFLLPIPPLLLGALWYGLIARGEAATSGLTFAMLVLPLATLVPIVLSALSVVVIKWSLIGRVKPAQHALWSCWCSRWDYFYVCWQKLGRVPLDWLEGTFLLTIYLRAMGLKIGKRAVLGPQFSQVVDPDMIEVGDHATACASYQAHTFEDRVLKVGPVRFEAGSTVGAGTVPLYGAVVGKGAHVGAGSVIMKAEALNADTRYQGAPTRVVGIEA
ncbi:non-ribosomal peptide synthetase [Novosphingobium sp.]|uniref:non-ribosomal peptide synthetase n=1 Tax=Novosphingobium sp. TaxID=1874826 RepID=UPI0025E217FF|nr:non-ribosomal peptide synthetase [Novosphingobium sp.]